MKSFEISFKPLRSHHFPLLLKWLETPHVKAWWDQDIQWTPQLIKEKYGSYINGYKLEKGLKKNLEAFIIYEEMSPIGYIQLYNAYDFPRENGVLPETLPKKLGALDFYIGEPNLLGKGLGAKILIKFIHEYVQNKFDACFVDPDRSNQHALRTYEKAGFHPIQSPLHGNEIWLMKVLTDVLRSPNF